MEYSDARGKLSIFNFIYYCVRNTDGLQYRIMTMPEKTTKAFRKNLAELCAKNQGRVAESAGISRVHLNRIIHGHCCPSLDVAFALAKSLGVSIDTLLETRPVSAA